LEIEYQKWNIGFENRELHKHKREDFLTKIAPVNYDKEAIVLYGKHF